jgi:hypothetical protein
MALSMFASFSAIAATWDDEANVIIAEVHKAHVQGLLNPTCEGIATYGKNILQDIGTTSQLLNIFLNASVLRVLRRRAYYLGLFSMARKGATAEDYEALSAQCWRILPRWREHSEQSMLSMLSDPQEQEYRVQRWEAWLNGVGSRIVKKRTRHV